LYSVIYCDKINDINIKVDNYNNKAGDAMKLQVSLDRVGLSEALELASMIGDIADIIEAGTPAIHKEGMAIVRAIRSACPAAAILADLKIVDGGDYAASMAFEAGADIVTVAGFSSNETIRSVACAAKRYGKEVMVDLIHVPDIASRAAELDSYGVDYMCVHTGFDGRKPAAAPPLRELRILNRAARKARSAIASGIGLDTLLPVMRENPHVIIVGSGIVNADNVREAALAFKRHLSERKDLRQR
jgi:3-hexulose-6-phosphate synthase